MKALTPRDVLLFWLPLAATWWMMALEQPLCSGLAARLPEPERNLAAFAVAMSMFFVIESPVWLLLSAANVLVGGWNSYVRLRNFACVLSGAMTVLLFVFFLPGPFQMVAQGVFAVPEELIAHAQLAGLILVPAPFFVGYRRFYQGILVRSLNTKAVAAGTVFRLASMVLIGVALFRYGRLSGAAVGACVLTTGVVVEAVVARIFCSPVIARYKSAAEHDPGLSYAYIIRFYVPLMLNGLVFSITGPMFTFFLSRLERPLESLAVYPVINAILFMFVSVTIAVQDVVIARLGPDRSQFAVLQSFARRLGAVLALLLGVIAFTPLLEFVLVRIIGLTPELARYAIPSTRIGALLPLLSVWGIWQRSILLHARLTVPASWASAVEVGVTGLVLALILFAAPVPGAPAVFAALGIGRLCACFYLVPTYRRAAAVRH